VQILKKNGSFMPDIVMAGGFIEESQIYKSIALSNFGEGFFRCSAELKEKYIERFDKISWEAVGLYSYLHDRIRIGLQHLMPGSRRFRIDLLDRSNLLALTERASEVTGIPMPLECDLDLIEQILAKN